MQLKTILNRVQKFESFVYGKFRWVDGSEVPTVEVTLHARANSRPVCSVCGRRGPGYDILPTRRFEFIPFWGIKLFFLYALRRVNCKRCGIKVEQVPWASGKHQLSESYAWFLAGWAKRLSWLEVANAFRTSWDHVFNSVEMAVNWGRAHQDLSGIKAIGVDEYRLAAGAQIPDSGLPDRCKQPQAAVDRQRSQGENLAGLFSLAGPGANRQVASDLQRYVEAVSESHRQKSRPRRSYSGPISYHGTDEQGD